MILWLWYVDWNKAMHRKVVKITTMNAWEGKSKGGKVGQGCLHGQREIKKDKKNTAMLYSSPSAFSESSSEKGGSWRAWQIWLQSCCAVKALIPSGPWSPIPESLNIKRHWSGWNYKFKNTYDCWECVMGSKRMSVSALRIVIGDPRNTIHDG